MSFIGRAARCLWGVGCLCIVFSCSSLFVSEHVTADFREHVSALPFNLTVRELRVSKLQHFASIQTRFLWICISTRRLLTYSRIPQAFACHFCLIPGLYPLVSLTMRSTSRLCSFWLAHSSLKERQNQNKRALKSVHAWKCLYAGDTSLSRTPIWTPSSGNSTGKVSFKTFYFLSLGWKIIYNQKHATVVNNFIYSIVYCCYWLLINRGRNALVGNCQRAVIEVWTEGQSCVVSYQSEIWFTWQLIIRWEQINGLWFYLPYANGMEQLIYHWYGKLLSTICPSVFPFFFVCVRACTIVFMYLVHLLCSFNHVFWFYILEKKKVHHT